MFFYGIIIQTLWKKTIAGGTFILPWVVKVGVVGFGENFPEFEADGLRLVNGPSKALVDPPRVNTNFI